MQLVEAIRKAKAKFHLWPKVRVVSCYEAGRDIKDCTWHDLRHTWASWHVMNGTRLEELQRLGGWKTMDMVLRYAHLSREHLARVADNVRPVSAPKL